MLGEEPSVVLCPDYLPVGFAAHLADLVQPQTSPNLLIPALSNLHRLLFPLELFGHRWPADGWLTVAITRVTD